MSKKSKFKKISPHHKAIQVVISFKLEELIGFKTEEEVDKFFFMSSPYHDFQIRVTFLEKQTCNDEFKILSRYYLVNTEDRKKLATSRVETENIIYSNGMTRRKN